MAIKKEQLPDSAGQDQSLTTSNTLPEFLDLEREWKAQIEEIQAEQTTTKKTTKKKSAAATPAQTPLPDSGASIQIEPEAIEQWCCMPLDLFFDKSGKKSLSRIERLAWSRSCAELFNKYAPQFTNKYGAEIGAAICLVTIFASRMSPPEIKKKKEAEKEPEKKQPEKEPSNV